MARGRKPIPPEMKLVTGTLRRDRDGDVDVDALRDRLTAPSFGPLTKPPGLKGVASQIWDRVVMPAAAVGHLDAGYEPAAIIYVELAARLQTSPHDFSAGLYGQLRAYGAVLGLGGPRRR